MINKTVEKYKKLINKGRFTEQELSLTKTVQFA